MKKTIVYSALAGFILSSCNNINQPKENNNQTKAIVNDSLVQKSCAMQTDNAGSGSVEYCKFLFRYNYFDPGFFNFIYSVPAYFTICYYIVYLIKIADFP